MRRIVACALVGLLAACSAGSSLEPQRIPPNLVQAGRATKHKVKATIRISIPKRKHHHRILVHGHYVSPATQSIAITVTPSGGSPQSHNANLTPASNPNCVASLISPLVCTISLALPVGSYTATFATYDGLLDGNGNPTGNELSANQNVPVTIVAGQPNDIGVTLDGLPASVLVVPLDGALTPTSANHYTASKCFPSARVEVLGVDADGNAILGPGAPVPSLSSADAAHLAAATPSPSSPNTFVLTRPNIPNPNSSVQLTAGVTPASDSGGAVQTTQVNVTFNYDICGVITEYPIANVDNPYSITAGPDGNLWFTEADAKRVGTITTSGVITEYGGLTGGEAFGIAPGPDGNLWLAEYSVALIAKITTSGAVTEYGGMTGGGPFSIAAGADGNMWFTETSGLRIGRITMAGVVNEYGNPGSNGAYGIAAGPDGNMWFTDVDHRIGLLGVDRGGSEFATLPNNVVPWGITTGPDGNLWFTEINGFGVGKITPSGVVTEYPGLGSSSHEGEIVAGPDGNLWFGDGGGNAVGKITTSGSVTEYPIATPNGYPVGVAVGSDGNIWFAELSGNKIGRLQ